MEGYGVDEEDGDVSGDRDGDRGGYSWGKMEIDIKKCTVEWKLCITESIGDADRICSVNS
jgi:hypothetical protein